MRKVIGIGETVLDIIFRDDQPISALPGGSTFNAIISLGRAGVCTGFISETGNDHVGRLITNFLEKNGCSASSICIYPDSKSPLSLAFLNERNDADYVFYKQKRRIDGVLLKLPVPVRCLCITAVVILIMIYGTYGTRYNVNSFIYANF